MCEFSVALKRRANEAGVKNDRADKEERDVYDYHARVSAHRPMADYSLWHCLGYVFYAPLYLAGPTITYNAYVSHVGTDFCTLQRSVVDKGEVHKPLSFVLGVILQDKSLGCTDVASHV